MKTKNIFGAIFGIVFFLALASMVSAGIWFDFESDPSASSMTVPQGAQLNLVMTASSHNNIVVSSEKLEAVGVGTLQSWNEPGSQFGSTHLWTKTHTLDTNILGPGTFTLRFSAQTSAGLESADLTLIVNPVDTTSPVITILGTNPITIALGSVYTDAGATALDNLDGVITSQISVVNNVNTAVLGTYTVTYSVSDLAGNLGTAIRTVIVSISADTTAPTLTISSPINGQTYTTAPTNITYVPTDVNLNKCWYSLDGGVTNSTAVSCNNGISNLFSGLVPVQGSNTWNVWANDTAGNLGNALVTFTVNDLTAPVITAVSPLNNETLDDTDVTFKVSTNEDAVLKYSLDGAANVTMTKTSNFEFWSALLDLDDDEEYTVVYTATDVMGNTASLTIKFNIDEDASDNAVDDTFFSTEDDDEGITIEPAIDLTDEEGKSLNWWQRFINWLARLFGLEEVY
ncbi:MAG: DUF5011 domain-containing protein [Nanoarchaeota archaeon]|nr:DUF5011 domain-containing protein [Nanoarchaeota archaeon]